MQHGFFRAVAAVPRVFPGNCRANADSIKSLVKDIHEQYGPDYNIDLIVLPELCITGYTCGDMFHHTQLIKDAESAMRSLANSKELAEMPVLVGAPVLVGNVLYNCAVLIFNGIRAVIPKTYIPNYNEFYEKRWWQPAPDRMQTIYFAGYQNVSFGTKQLIDIRGVKVGVEICEDLWAPVSPGTHAALAGAEIIANLSASNDLIGKYNYLNDLISGQSARTMCGYVYASAGYGESSTDLVFDGKAIVAENGSIIARNKRWTHYSQFVAADIDIEALRHDRMHVGTFAECSARDVMPDQYHVVTLDCIIGIPHSLDGLLRNIDPHPFVPAGGDILEERCEEVINIQVAGLMRRLDFTHCRSLVVGISGGLDSTLALLVAVRAFDELGLDRKGIIGVTMPGFGTTGRTYNNALALMRSLGVTIREISIVKAVEQHFEDIGHDPLVHDITYENSQARERTQILMDIANQTGGMVLGTGDLSELALGWATYNGDHMSMYGVNASVPKTLVRYLTRYFAENTPDELTRNTLLDIIDTPVSPELLPAGDKGDINQKTEDLVGPYELHDFFLYYFLRYGFSVDRIELMARQAFAGQYDPSTIRHWLEVFVRRFYSQQFKRSCLPDGPKVGSVCLSPRGDWRMPSDLERPDFRYAPQP